MEKTRIMEKIPIAPANTGGVQGVPVTREVSAAEIVFADKAWKPRFTIAAIRLARVNHGTELAQSDLEAGNDLGMLAKLSWIACLWQAPTMSESEFLTALMQADPVMETRLWNAVKGELAKLGEALAEEDSGDETAGKVPG